MFKTALVGGGKSYDKKYTLYDHVVVSLIDPDVARRHLHTTIHDFLLG